MKKDIVVNLGEIDTHILKSLSKNNLIITPAINKKLKGYNNWKKIH